MQRGLHGRMFYDSSLISCHLSHFLHRSLTSTANWQQGKRAMDESADAAAAVDVLIPSRAACLITAVSGLSLLNFIQDHSVSF